MYQKTHVHLMGIGGIGMSGIAKILRSQGYTVSGCDTDHEQPTIKELKTSGCHIHKGNNTPECADPSIEVLVYSSAIKESNPEIQAAQEKGIPTIPRASMLAEIMRTKYSIAVTGAHGKTTTTSLISHIMIEAQLDPTVIIGGHLHNISSNAQLGTGEFLVAEADESDRSFLKLYPTLAVVTNIDLEHLETYKDIDDIKQSYAEFLSHVPFYGKAIVCLDDLHIRSLLPLHQIKTIKYALDHKEAELYGDDLILEKDYSTCTVYHNQQKLGTLTLTMPGKHNMLNALGALAVTLDVGVSFETAVQALKNFKGIDRRFSYRGTINGAEVFDDYGHHPTEIINTLQVARKRTNGKLIVAFQPHRYTRTQQLWDDFVHVFAYSQIDELIITDIYPASEAPIEGITAQTLVTAIQEKHPTCTITYMPFDDTSLINALKDKASKDDMILLQGAGKITNLAKLLCP